jgi:nicotinic acetylcholine receptor
MEIPSNETAQKKPPSKKSTISHANSQNELNEQLSSKSLLANVLDINDDFIIGSPNSRYHTSVSSKNQLHMSRGANRGSMRQHSSNDPNYSPYSGGGVGGPGGVMSTSRGAGGGGSGEPFLRRENSTMSQSGNYEMSDGGGGVFSSGTSKNDIISVKKNLICILREIKQITQKIKDDEEDESKELSWKFAAMVIDRLCLITFSLCTLTSTVSILMTSKNFFMPSDPDPIF